MPGPVLAFLIRPRAGVVWEGSSREPPGSSQQWWVLSVLVRGLQKRQAHLVPSPLERVLVILAPLTSCGCPEALSVSSGLPC